MYYAALMHVTAQLTTATERHRKLLKRYGDMLAEYRDAHDTMNDQRREIEELTRWSETLKQALIERNGE